MRYPHNPARNFQLFFLITILFLTSCQPEGFINKVKYKGETFTNTCESFTADVKKLIGNNSQANKLQVSEYDNSDFSYYYLEPGQFELRQDSVYFRLENNLNFPKYLDKGVAIKINLGYKADPRIEGYEDDKEGELGTLMVDRKYYVLNRKPFFLYKFPLNGKDIKGKQLTMSFAIAKFNNSGDLKKYFCETETQPFGVATPACCTSLPWENTHLQSVVTIPEIKVGDESFTYSGFTATIDVTFQEGAFNYPDSLLSLAIQGFIEKYKRLDYEATEIDLKGYASPGGKEELNQELSQKRAEAVYQGLAKLNADNRNLKITYKGLGEDWLRVEELAQKSTVLTEAEKDQVREIARQDITNDMKEASLRKVDFWEKLVDDVLIKTRHTYAVLNFNYIGDLPTLERYAQSLPLASGELERVAGTKFSVGPYAAGKNIDEELKTLNQVLQKKASANLYAMRSTYMLAQKDHDKTIADLKKASELDKKNQQYALAIQGYQVRFADGATLDDRKKLYEEYTTLTEDNPGDRKIFFTRAILMDKVGLTGMAVEEYSKLFEGATPSATQINNRGVAKLKANMFLEAEKDFLDAASKNSTLAEPKFNLAAIYAFRGLTSKTIEYLDQAIALNGQYKSLIFNNPVFSVVSEDPKFDKYR